MRAYKKPDLNAPRFRPKSLNFANKKFFDELVLEKPNLKKYSHQQLKEMLHAFNGRIWNQVVDTRDGVELPNQLGFLFIGSCPRLKDNPNRKLSEEMAQRVQHQNWESDQYTCKIFYTNFETKYRFRFHELWGFDPVREFTRRTGQVYPKQWKIYRLIDPLLKISRLYRKQKAREFIQRQVQDNLGNYDQFDMTD